MPIQALRLLKKNLSSPDNTRSFPNGKVDTVRLEDTEFSRIELQPGWDWEKDVKPQANTGSCQVQHIQYVISGRLLVKTDDGTELEISAGDAVVLPPGHTARVIGSEPFRAIDFSSEMKSYPSRPEPTYDDYDYEMDME